MRFRSALYRSARIMGDVDAVRSGRVGRRIKNRAVGRALGGAFWRWLWR